MLLKQMDDRVQVEREWFKSYRFHIVPDVGALRRLVDMCAKRGVCSLDVETTGVDNRIYPDEYFEDGVKTRHGCRTVDRIVGVCISPDGSNGYYIPLTHEPEDSGNLPWDESWDELTRLIESCRIIFHNAKFDQEFLVPVTGREFWRNEQFEDTFLVAKVISPLKSNPAGLKQLAHANYGVDMVELDELFTDEKKEQLKRQKVRYNFALLHPKEGREYGGSDGIFTYKLWFTLSERIEKEWEHIYKLEKNFCQVMREMERNRVHVDVDRVQQLYVECKAELEGVGDLIRDIVEAKTGRTGKWLKLGVGSPTQLSDALFTDPEGLKLKPTPEMIQVEGGGFAVNYDDSSSEEDDDDDDGPEKKVYSLKDEVMKSLNRAYGQRYGTTRREKKDKEGKVVFESLFDLILEYRHYDKMKGSYVEKLFKSHDKYGDVRPSFNQIGTETARLSCKAGKIEDGYSGVNFQGIPRDSDEDKPELFKQIRTVIVPRPGRMLVKIDYAGEELRVITNMSGDPIWAKSFLHGDGDVHSITARALFGKPSVNKDERNRGKRSNFAIIYGGGAGAISRNIGCSIEEGGAAIENMRKEIPVLMGYIEHQKAFARKYKCIYTAFGRKMPIPTIDSPIKAIRKKAERCAINYTIQSTSADVLKYAMCYVDRKLRELGWKDRCQYVLTVHDEVVFEIDPRYLMEVVRMLDEWMVTPWRLPKAHGRAWTVPLETEPGIDIHWRARFDYFAMVDGKPADPKDLDADGNFVGKLKKDQYFADGRVYQKIPDFLEGHIWRLTPDQVRETKEALAAGSPIPHHSVANQLPPPGPSLVDLGLREKPEVVVTNGAEEKPVLVEEKPVETMTGPKPEVSVIDVDLDSPSDLSLDDRPPSEPPPSSPDDLELDVSFSLPSPSPSPSPSPKEEEERPAVPEKKPAPVDGQDWNPAALAVARIMGPKRPYQEGETVLRWIMSANPSVDMMADLICVLMKARGEVPLRIVNLKGQVIIPETAGYRVDPVKFRYLAADRGLGN